MQSRYGNKLVVTCAYRDTRDPGGRVYQFQARYHSRRLSDLVLELIRLSMACLASLER